MSLVGTRNPQNEQFLSAIPRKAAAALGHAEVDEMLVGRGADRTVWDKSGKTALDLAADDAVRRALVAR